MSTEREFLIHHLRELLKMAENPESDLSQLRPWLRCWWAPSTDEEVCTRLSRIEKQLSSLETRRCAFTAGDNSSHIMSLITGIATHRHGGQKYITSWLTGAEKLTVVDPYFFSFGGSNKVFRTSALYIEWLLEFIPKQTKTIDVFHRPIPNRLIHSAISVHCRKKGITLKAWETKEIHDRVLIKNDEEAKLIGTSFNSLGNKIAFILDMPDEDLNLFRRELRRIKTVCS
jgi:hypothetical protein